MFIERRRSDIFGSGKLFYKTRPHDEVFPNLCSNYCQYCSLLPSFCLFESFGVFIQFDSSFCFAFCFACSRYFCAADFVPVALVIVKCSVVG